MTNPNISPNPAGAPKRLLRNRNDRMLAGICSGMAQYAGMDPTLMRVIWVLGTLITSGALLLAYLIMIFVVPEN